MAPGDYGDFGEKGLRGEMGAKGLDGLPGRKVTSFIQPPKFFLDMIQFIFRFLKATSCQTAERTCHVRTSLKAS